jgi:hypothetical protein
MDREQEIVSNVNLSFYVLIQNGNNIVRNAVKISFVNMIENAICAESAIRIKWSVSMEYESTIVVFVILKV